MHNFRRSEKPIILHNNVRGTAVESGNENSKEEMIMSLIEEEDQDQDQDQDSKEEMIMSLIEAKEDRKCAGLMTEENTELLKEDTGGLLMIDELGLLRLKSDSSIEHSNFSMIDEIGLPRLNHDVSTKENDAHSLYLSGAAALQEKKNLRDECHDDVGSRCGLQPSKIMNRVKRSVADPSGTPPRTPKRHYRSSLHPSILIYTFNSDSIMSLTYSALK